MNFLMKISFNIFVIMCIQIQSPDPINAAAGNIQVTNAHLLSISSNNTETIEKDSSSNSSQHLVEKFYLDDLKMLLNSLEDPVAHNKLVSQIRALIGLHQGKEHKKANPIIEVWDNIVKEVHTTSNHVAHTIGLASELRTLTKWFLTEAKKDPWEKWEKPFIYILISGILGLMSSWISKILLRVPQNYVSNLPLKTMGIFFIERVLQVILWTLPYICFSLFTYLFATLLGIDSRMEGLLIGILTSFLVVGVTHMSLKVIFSPHVSKKRVISTSNKSAKTAYSWLFMITGWGLWFYFAMTSIQHLRLPSKINSLFDQFLGFIITIQLIYFILRNRKFLKEVLQRRLIRRKHNGKTIGHRLIKTFCQIWHIPSIVAIITCYFTIFFGAEWEFSFLISQTCFSLGLFFIARLIVNIVTKYQKAKIKGAFSSYFPLLHARLHNRIDTLVNLFAYLIYFFTIYIQFLFWNINLFDYIVDEQNNLFSFVKGLLKTFFTFLTAYSAWITADLMIAKYIEKEDEKALKLGYSLSGRLQTLIPIIRKIVLFFLSSVVIFVFLGTLGIDPAAMLGGFAIISLGISLGAQTFIKDVLTGFFIILEDSIVINDTVEIDGKMGEVESITLRSIRLRDKFGSIHTIPLGEVKVLTNMSREYGYAIINLNFSYEDDVDYISKALIKIGEDLLNDSVYGIFILDPIEIKNINQSVGFSILLECRIKTKPGEQFKIKHELYTRIKSEFNHLGIVMPVLQ